MTRIDDSTLSESVVGDGTVQSNDVDIDAHEGSAVSFGDGDASAATQGVDIDGNDGTVQIAGDDFTQTAATGNSVNDSYNTTHSFNTDVDDADTTITDSFNTDVDYTDNSVTDSYNDQSDDDFVDVDAGVEAPAEEPPEL